MKVTAPVKPNPETYQILPKGVPRPPPVVPCPPQFLEPQTRRLPPELREQARTYRDYPPLHALNLPHAAFMWYAADKLHLPQHTVDFARALADLSVTGRKAWNRFSDAKITLQMLYDVCGEIRDLDARTLYCTKVLQRAYDVAWALRGPPSVRENAPVGAGLRKSLGWICCSGEDDTPHRPVNVGTAPWPQFDIKFDAKKPPASGATGTVPMQTRFMIASLENKPGPARDTSKPWDLPPDPDPVVPEGNRVILFLHGDSSNCEESLELVDPLLEAGAEKKIPLTVIALDFPNCGYSRRFESYEVAHEQKTNIFPTIQTPMLEFIEEFLVAFVDALDAKTTIKDRIIGVVGGSLGGNMGLRLGRRPEPWLGTKAPRGGMSPDPGIVAFSPASVWNQPEEGLNWMILTNGRLQKMRLSWQDAQKPPDFPPEVQTPIEPPDRRLFFINDVFETPMGSFPGWAVGAAAGGAAAVAGGILSFADPVAMIGTLATFMGTGAGIGAGVGAVLGDLILLPSQPTTWYADTFPGKHDAIEWARASQQECYDPVFRRWHWRSCFEQVVSSHFQNGPDGQPHYKKNTGRTLLMAGSADDYMGAHIYSRSRMLAPLMTNDRGRSVFYIGVGHSIPSEVPMQMTAEIISFLIDEAKIIALAPLPVPVTLIEATWIPPAPDMFAGWHTTKVVPDNPGQGGIKGNSTVYGTFNSSPAALAYVALDVDQIELTRCTQPPELSVLTLAQMGQFSFALTREIDAGSSHAGELKQVRKAVETILKAKTP